MLKQVENGMFKKPAVYTDHHAGPGLNLFFISRCFVEINCL
ncbi:hypothetical protein CLOSTMETH_02480 [[Clostridium] methylpentosum DSM 5476]|uniref:Uncharacterized protein n=1 Tax=[Clostridium] methylpentosum DSM 5476 TaxID=537013 RepID=C0EF41_9FIRM|nr:hypothetical protein CLOSTMETH_02480 [[Clostridium] methylpentosum DSM 5476]